jgi:hypothetical protein
MTFTLADLMQFSNVLLIPAVIYIVKLEARLAKLETRLEHLLTSLECSVK